MDKKMLEMKKITELDAVPGNERECRHYMKDRLEGLADEISYDKLGSIIAKKVGNSEGPRIMVAGHMDEIGFMVTEITKEGFIKFTTLGGWWSQVMLAQQVRITTSKGDKIIGAIGSKPPHILTPEERNKPADIKKMFIDIGSNNEEETRATGVREGDMITPHIEFREMPGNKDFLMGKAFDNRVGCAIAIDVLEELKDEKHENIVYSVGTVQEEVGLRGAKTTSNIVNPDIAFALDVGIADDIPGGDAKGKLGAGPQITLRDASIICHKGLREFVTNVCDELKIPYQFQTLLGGGTDAGAMHLAHDGAPALSIGIPSRYIHSHTSMIHKQDYLNAVKLLKEVIKRLDKETVNKIIID